MGSLSQFVRERRGGEGGGREGEARERGRLATTVGLLFLLCRSHLLPSVHFSLSPSCLQLQSMKSRGSSSSNPSPRGEQKSAAANTADGADGGVPAGRVPEVQAVKVKAEEKRESKDSWCIRAFLDRIADCLTGADTLPPHPNDASVNLDSLVAYFRTGEEPRNVQELALASIMYLFIYLSYLDSAGHPFFPFVCI